MDLKKNYCLKDKVCLKCFCAKKNVLKIEIYLYKKKLNCIIMQWVAKINIFFNLKKLIIIILIIKLDIIKILNLISNYFNNKILKILKLPGIAQYTSLVILNK